MYNVKSDGHCTVYSVCTYLLHGVDLFEHYSVTLNDSVGFVLILQCRSKIHFSIVQFVMYITVTAVVTMLV